MSSTLSSISSLLIQDRVALNYEKNPSDPFYVYARPESDDIVTITHLEFARATHRAASILDKTRQGDGQVVAIIALSDTVLYHALLVGLMTANYIPFPISPRNSPAGILQLLRASDCHRIIGTCVTLESLFAGLKDHISGVQPNFMLEIQEAPSLQEIYPNLGTETANSSFEPHSGGLVRPSLDDVALYIHSSGSTGFPRAVPQTHRVVSQWFNLPAVADTQEWQPIGSMALPSFHLFGIFQQLLQPLAGRCAAVYPPTATSSTALPMIPSPDNTLDHARRTRCRSLITVPAFLVIWFDSPDALAYLTTLHTILWSGGPLPHRIGDTLVASGVRLLNGYGATEFGPISTMIPYEEDTKDWAWFRISDLVTVRWAPQGDGTFECQLLTSDNHTPMVENLPDVRGYATSDLCIRNPQKSHLWKVVGRIDDTIVHTSGEKTVPAPMEDVVTSSSHVAAAVTFGHARAQTGILIAPAGNLQIDVKDAIQVADLRNKIWPAIQEANAIAPAFSRIFKEMILFTAQDKPLPRTGKGTVQRKAALTLYAEEIDAIYNAVEDQTAATEITPPAVWESGHIQEWLLTLAKHLLNSNAVSPTVDLRQQGFDSLTATIFRLHVMKALRSGNDPSLARAADAITQNLVYSYPTIAQLRDYIGGFLGGKVSDLGDEGMENMVAKYTTSTIPAAGTLTAPVGRPATVLLTGSTGNLGSQILASLLKDVRVTKIYALNRASTGTAAERHLRIFKERGLDELLLGSPKLIFVEAKTDQPNLNLSPDLYREICNSLTLVIHNAWKVDFNMPLASFEPHIRGTRHLIDLALSIPHAPRFVFASSIASALSWDPTLGPCPEDILNDKTVAMRGYGESKYAGEQMLAKSGLNATCLRIGQVCGALPKGAWATTNWLPILVKTSITLGVLPLADGLVSWTDFETVAQAVMDVAFSPLEDAERLPIVLNLVHPRPVSWNFVVTCVRDVLLKEKNGRKNLKLVGFPEWYKNLEAGARYAAENLPGLRLLEFFRRLANSPVGSADAEFGGISFSNEKMQAWSPAVRGASSLTEANVEAWVDYWHASGYI